MSKNDHFTVKQSTERLFVPVYQDFLDSKVLNGKEKIVFIMLKRYLTFGNDEGEVYPTIDTLCKQCDMSKPTIIKILKQLENKGVLKIEQRGLNKPNLYTLYDLKNIWNSNSKQEVIEAINENEEERLIDFLRAKGYFVTKEKEVVSATDQSTDSTSQINTNSVENNTTTKMLQSQENIAFTRQMLNEKYDFEILVSNDNTKENYYDQMLELIYDVLNSNAKTIRIGKEDKPSEVVKARLLKLNYMHIQYVVDEVIELSNIKNKKAYLITSLYNSYTTLDFHYSNLVNKNK